MPKTKQRENNFGTACPYVSLGGPNALHTTRSEPMPLSQITMMLKLRQHFKSALSSSSLQLYRLTIIGARHDGLFLVPFVHEFHITFNDDTGCELHLSFNLHRAAVDERRYAVRNERVHAVDKLVEIVKFNVWWHTVAFWSELNAKILS